MLQPRKPKPGQQKPKLKKTRTFTNSQQTLCEEQRNFSLLDFSKPEQRKKNGLGVKKNQSQRQLQGGGKKGQRGKSKGKLHSSAPYQFVNYKCSLNSEIVFSNEETAREEEKENRLTIRVKPAYLVESKQLGANIKREYQRKVEAAIKIQKVFRGFLTRKVLQRCMEREQERLHTRLLALRPEIFAKVSSCNNYYDKRPQVEAEDQSESDEDRCIAYRHHQPIFSEEEIRDYLSSSEEEDFDQKAFDNHIIFETNEEYFDSHKSSLNHPQPKNKLSASHFFQQEALSKEDECLQKKIQLNLSDQIEKDSTLKIHKHSMQDFEKTLPNQIDPAQLGETIKDNYHTLKNGVSIAKRSELEQLKSEQAKKWHEMISFLKAHSGNENIQEQKLISSLIKLSQLNMTKIKQTQKTQKYNHMSQISSLNREKSKEKVLMLKQSRKILQKAVENKIAEDVVEVDQPVRNTIKERRDDQDSNSKLKFSQNPIELKKFFRSLQSHSLQPLVKLREEAIKANEMEEMRKLSQAIESKKISQEVFLLRLDEINRSYNLQKAQVAEQKEAIKKGYQAIIEQAKGAVFEAHLLGQPLPFSRSDEGIKYKTSIKQYLPPRPETIQTIKPEEKKERRAEVELIRIESSEQQSSDLSFSEQQLLRFQKAKMFNLQFEREIAGLGSNVTISQQLQREKIGDQSVFQQGDRKQAGRQIFLIEDFSIPQVPVEQEQAADEMLNQLIWQAAGELFLRPIFTKKLIDKSLLSMPGKVSDAERLSFIEHLQRHFPSVEMLNSKLNQKISPLPKELLRCMRIDFSEDSEAESYQEIGKYEFIIGQEVCNQAVRSFRKSLEPSLRVIHPALDKVEQLCKVYEFPQKLKRYLLQREKYVCDRLSQTQELRWQVMNIEIHCIFDAWNEEIIALRSERVGYSGIGLNELTLSIVDQNVRVREEQTLSVVAAGKERLLECLSQGSPGILFPRAVKELEEDLQRNSKWIFYADEALSYALELVYLIEEDIFAEIGRDLLGLGSP